LGVCFVTVLKERGRGELRVAVYSSAEGALVSERAIELTTQTHLQLGGRVVLPLELTQLKLTVVLRECEGRVSVSPESAAVD